MRAACSTRWPGSAGPLGEHPAASRQARPSRSPGCLQRALLVSWLPLHLRDEGGPLSLSAQRGGRNAVSYFSPCGLISGITDGARAGTEPGRASRAVGACHAPSLPSESSHSHGLSGPRAEKQQGSRVPQPQACCPHPGLGSSSGRSEATAEAGKGGGGHTLLLRRVRKDGPGRGVTRSEEQSRARQEDPGRPLAP